MAITWEYLTANYPPAAGALEDLGRQGWELAAAIAKEGPTPAKLIFKRVRRRRVDARVRR